jgi:NhaP-type Na+/H+ or K+/H+ antiporter
VQTLQLLNRGSLVISLLTGIVVGPDGLGFIRPGDYTGCDMDGTSTIDCQNSLGAITLNFSRLVLCIQLVLAGVQLPSKYLKRECKSLLLLIGPGMAAMWLTTSILVYICINPPSSLHALAVGACVTPTDPVLSAVIVKGRFADQNIPRELQDLIIAESGLNDGLGYPFLFFALYLIKFAGAGADSASGGIADAMGLWLVLTWGYTILLSILYGALVGWTGKKLLQWAERNKYIDHESFLVFAIALALFLLGTCGLLGTDDVLACFIAGNAFTWDDWFRLRTKDDSLQPTVDMLLNVNIFLWYGASLPWNSFVDTPNISLWRLLILGALVLAFRRLPWIVAMRQWIPQLENARQAVFAGFFGPIGVSAVFYLFIALDFIEAHLSAGQGNPGGPRTDVVDLAQTLRTVVWFLVVCSIVCPSLGSIFHPPSLATIHLTLHEGHPRSRRPTRQSFLYGSSDAEPRVEHIPQRGEPPPRSCGRLFPNPNPRAAKAAGRETRRYRVYPWSTYGKCGRSQGRERGYS